MICRLLDSVLIRRRCIRCLRSHGLLHVNRNVKGSLLPPKPLPCLVSFSTQGQPPKLPHHKPDLPFPQDPSAPALTHRAPSPGAAHQGPGFRTTICGINLFLWVSILTPRGRQTYFFQINPVLSPRRIPRAIAERVKVSLSSSCFTKFRQRTRGRAGLITGCNGVRARISSPSTQSCLLPRHGGGWAETGLWVLLGPRLCIQGRKHPPGTHLLEELHLQTHDPTYMTSQTAWPLGRQGSRGKHSKPDPGTPVPGPLSQTSEPWPV